MQFPELLRRRLRWRAHQQVLETERGVRRRIQSQFRDGVYDFCDSVDDDGNGWAIDYLHNTLWKVEPATGRKRHE